MSSVTLHNVSVEFPIYELKARSLKKSLLQLGAGGSIDSENHGVVLVKALNEISFSLKSGNRLGLIGHNGAGKSTLLRTLAGIYEPNKGHIEIEGKVVALLDIMLGMDNDSTGYDNIMLQGIIRGLSKKEILGRQEEIAEFTKLGDYLAMPIRTYSSGMRLRLAFAIATSIDADILVLDEVVGAGDANFMEKAKDRLNQLIHQADIMILASHSDEVIRNFCNKVLWLEAGKIKFMGNVEEGLARYNNVSARRKATALVA